MAFFKTVKESIYSPTFYATVPKKTFGSAFKYFVLLALLVAVFSAIRMEPVFFKTVPQWIDDFTKNAAEIYPNDLVVNVIDGQVSINQPEPYLIPVPANLKEDMNKAGIFNLLVVDTVTPFSAGQLDEYGALAWLMEDGIAVKSNQRNGEVRTYSLSQARDFTIDRQKVDELFTKLQPYAKFAINFSGPILFVFFVIAVFIGGLFRMVYLLLFAVVTYVVGKLLKVKLTYGQAYKVSMYAVTLGILIDLVLMFVGAFITVPQIPYLFTMVTTAVVLVNLQAMKKVKA
jgi:hypothetical protein